MTAWTPTVSEADREWLRRFRGHQLGHPVTAEATLDLTRQVLAAGVPGDLVECGVFAGVHPAIMAHALVEREFSTGNAGSPPWNRYHVHLYDSFEGLPHGTPEDTDDIATRLHCQGLDGAMVPTGIAACSLPAVQAHMANWLTPYEQTALHYHPGWFCDTLGRGDDPEQIALLRLDVDIYAAMRDCLRTLYPRVQPGGIVICDDWTLAGPRQAIAEIVGDVEAIEIEGSGGTWWWRVP